MLGLSYHTDGQQPTLARYRITIEFQIESTNIKGEAKQSQCASDIVHLLDYESYCLHLSMVLDYYDARCFTFHE